MTPQLQPISSATIPAGALALSARDIERLLTEETPDIRIDVLHKVAGGHTKKQYSERELAIAEQIFRVLVKDTEVVVREALSQALKDNPSVPHDIIIALARDVDTVCLPIIECSEVLTDDDLIQLINSAKHTKKPIAAAKRSTLSEKVSLTLIDTANIQAISQLMKNPGARISDTMFQDVIKDYSSHSDVIESLAERPNLPITIVEKVITMVSGTLADMLRVQYQISPATIAVETEKTREVATLKLLDGKINTRDIEKLVDQLQVFGRLTPSIILTSLCRGNLYFFETSLARLSSIPVRNAQLLIHDKGGLGFKALYAKAGLPDKFFAAAKLLLEVVSGMQRNGQETGSIYSNALVQKLLAKASGKSIENLSYIIALIRQTA